jgi:hypothetical protein
MAECESGGTRKLAWCSAIEVYDSMKPPKFSLRAFFAFVAACAVMSGLILFVITGYHDHWTCALCRCGRTDYVYLDQMWRTELQENACSQWYSKNVEPDHDHVWVRARATALRDLYGNRFGAMDRDPVGRTIWSLSSDDQLRIYQHFPNPRDAKSVFFELASPQAKVKDTDYQILNALLAWRDSGFAGSWNGTQIRGGLVPPQAARNQQ